MARIIYPSADELVETNERVLEQIQVKRADRHGVLSRKKLEYAIEKTQNEEGDLYDKAAVLLIELVRGHAFERWCQANCVCRNHFLSQNQRREAGNFS